MTTMYRISIMRAFGALIVAVALCAAVGLAIRDAHNKAYAEELRDNGLVAYQEATAWSGEIVERETTEDGKGRERRLLVTCDGPARYRMVAHETDAQGEAVTTTTLRLGTDLYTHTRTTNGSSLHVVRNVPPSIGVVMDNALGQQVRRLKDAPSVRFLGREKVRDRKALKLAVADEHVVWLDEDSSLPLKEQTLVGDLVAEEIEFISFDDAPDIRAQDFDPGSLVADEVVEEDLGFRQIEAIDQFVESALGFTPISTSGAMAEAELLARGIIAPGTAGDGSTTDAVWTEQFFRDGACTLITQMLRPGVTITAQDGIDTLVTGGRTLEYDVNEWRTLVSVMEGEVLIVIESTLPLDEVTSIVARLFD